MSLADEEECLSTAVIDYGSYLTRVGLAGEAPSDCFRTVVTRGDKGDLFAGDEAINRIEQKRTRRTSSMSSGIMLSNDGWLGTQDEIEGVMQQCLQRSMRMDPTETSVAVARAYTGTIQKERWFQDSIEVLFEQMRVPSMFLADPSMCCLLSSGRTTGFVIDCGYRSTRCRCVFASHTLNELSNHIHIGGENILEKLLNHGIEANLPGHSSDPTATHDLRRHKHDMQRMIDDEHSDNVFFIKVIMDDQDRSTKKVTKIKSDIDDSQSCTKRFTLPDGRMFELSTQLQSECPEMYFTRSLWDPIMTSTTRMRSESELSSSKSVMTLTDMIKDSLDTCNLRYPNLFDSMTKNVVVCGGGSLIPGMTERLGYECDQMYPGICRVTLHDSGSYACYDGLSILATMPTFQSMMSVTKDEFDQHQMTALWMKFF